MYTEEMNKAVHSVPNLAGLQVDIMTYEECDPQFLGLRFYSSQWLDLSEELRYYAAMYLKELKESLEALGVLVTLEPVEGSPDE